MVNVTLVEVTPLVEDKIIKESLSRIGIADKKRKILYPSCYLVQKNDKYYIGHFKQLFSMIRENAFDNLSDEDIERRNSVIYCLSQWGLISVNSNDIQPHQKFVFVLPYSQKKDWLVNHKFNLNYLK